MKSALGIGMVAPSRILSSPTRFRACPANDTPDGGRKIFSLTRRGGRRAMFKNRLERATNSGGGYKRRLVTLLIQLGVKARFTEGGTTSTRPSSAFLFLLYSPPSFSLTHSCTLTSFLPSPRGSAMFVDEGTALLRRHT